METKNTTSTQCVAEEYQNTKAKNAKTQYVAEANQPLHLKSSPWLTSRHSHVSHFSFDITQENTFTQIRKYTNTQIHNDTHKYKYKKLHHIIPKSNSPVQISSYGALLCMSKIEGKGKG